MMLIQLQLSTVNQASSASSSGSSSGSSRRQKSTIQISSSSPPPYPTPPPSAPTSPSSDPSASSSSSVSSSHSKKVRVPLLSPGGLYPAPPPGKSSAHSLAGAGPVPQTIHRNYNPNQTQTPNTRDAFSRKSRSSRDGGSEAARGAPQPQAAGSESGGGEPPAKKPKLDTNALAEASKNLTQTLKQLSSEVLTTRTDSQETQPAPGTTTTSQIPKKEVRFRKDLKDYTSLTKLTFRHPLQAAAAAVQPAVAVQAPVAPAPAPALTPAPAPGVSGDTGGRGTAAGAPSLRACTTTARACTQAHSQVRTEWRACDQNINNSYYFRNSEPCPPGWARPAQEGHYHHCPHP